MGKKLQGARLRAKKRAREALDELQESQAEAAIVSGDALFVLDRDGTGAPVPPSLNKVAKTAKKLARKDATLSEHEQTEIDRLLKAHGKDKLIELADEGRKKLEASRNPFRVSKKAKDNAYDLWNDGGDNDDNDNAANKSKTSDPQDKPVPFKKAELNVAGIAPAHSLVKAKPNKAPPAVASAAPALVEAIPGQSYIPDQKAHSKIMEQAAAIEIKRERAVKKQRDPLSQGLTEETKAILIQGDSDDESSSDDESLPDGPVGPIPKRALKLTRAQRNKQKRIRGREAELLKVRTEKKLIKQIGEIPVFKKELVKLEAEKTQPNMTPSDKKRKRRDDDPVDVPSIPVLVQPSESLRSMKVMGSLVEDSRNSLAEHGLSAKPSFSHEAKLRRKIKRRRTRKKVRDIRK
jgi:Asp-tRNA(Asn)/Glu-tRNA(Gln) amidotransferase C subunit